MVLLHSDKVGQALPRTATLVPDLYLGYPLAHEDDAQRAIRAGLGIVAALPQLNAQLQQTVKVLQDFPLQGRIGIHTGLVVVGEMGGGEYREQMGSSLRKSL